MIKFDKKTNQYIIDDDNKDLYTLQDFETKASINALYKLVLIYKTDTGNEHFNYCDAEGMTPLCFCCLNQVDIRNIYYFVNDENDISPKPVKVNVDKISAKGKSPFQYAVLSRYMEMITLLHEGTIKVTVLDDEGNPKLQLDKWQDPVLDSNGDPIIITETYNINPTVNIKTNDYIAAVMMPDDKVIKALLPAEIPPADNDCNDPIVKELDVSKQIDNQSRSNLLLLACLAQVYGTITTLLSSSLAYGDIAESITNTNKNKKSAYSTTIELNDTGAQKLLEKYLEKVDVVYLYTMYNSWMQKDEDGNIDELFNQKAEKAVEDLYKPEHFTKIIDNKLYNVIDHLGNNHYFSQTNIDTIEIAINNETLDEQKLPHWEYTPAGIDFDTSIIELIEGAEGAKRTFKLNAKPNSDVIITIKSDHDDRLSISSSSLTLSSTNWNSDKNIITFTAIDDHIANGDLNFSITINSSSDDSRFNNIENTVQVKIKDNDEVGIVYDDSSIILNEGQSVVRTFKLKSQPLADVVLNISSDHNDKLTISSKQLIFTSSNWNINQSAIFTAIDDNIASGDLSFNIKIKSSSTDVLYNNIPENIISVTIKDDDIAGIIYDSTSEILNEGQYITRAFKLKSQPTSDVTLNISSNNSSRISISKPSLIFTASNWNTEQSVKFTAIDNNIYDGDVTVSVNIKSTSADIYYNNLSSGFAITVKDNDTSGIIADTTPTTITEGQHITRTFKLKSQPTSNVTLNISSNDTNSRLSISKSSLVFTESNWNIEQSVVFTAIDNNIKDDDVDVLVTIKSSSTDLSYNNLTSTYTITVKDNDVTANIGTYAFSSGLFTILLVDNDDKMIWSKPISSGSYSTSEYNIKNQWSSVYDEGYTVTQVPKSPHWTSGDNVFNYDLLYDDNLNE